MNFINLLFLIMNRFSNLFSLAVIWLLTSCATQKKPTTTPALTYKDFSEQPASVVTIPITVNLSSLFKEADETIAKSYAGNEEPCQGLRYSYNFTRSPIEFNGMGDKINIAFKGSYKMKMSYCATCAFDRCILPAPTASCGMNEPERRLDIGFSMSYQITPNYDLLSRTSLTQLHSVDPCKITFLNVDISDRITEIVSRSLNDICKQYDQETSKKNLKQPLQSIWDSLSAPTKLDDGFGYFSLKPLSLGLTPLYFSGAFLKFNAGLTIKPILNSDKPAITYSKIPMLSSFQPSDGFRVYADVIYNYDSLTQLLNRKISGKIFEMRKRKLVVEQIKIKGAANNLLLFHIEFSGYQKGSILISGHPYILPDALMAGLTETNIHLEKGSFFLKAAFLFYKKKIRKAVADYSKISLKDFTEESRISLEKKLNRSFQQKYQLRGKVHQLTLSDVFASEKVLKIRTRTTGNASLFVQ